MILAFWLFPFKLRPLVGLMKTDELREKYLEFFASKGCRRCDSDVLVPTWDPSVLFTPAGMNPFKDHFLGRTKLEFTRATSCQKCLRTGDIDNVGRTAYHHTFFEMLGNFSFGDYFKREAIHWAWEFLTDPKWLALDPDRLSVTVYQDDDEAADIWHQEIELPTSRIQRMGEDDNFWPAGAPTQGPDGVCGPCSEIFFHPDQGGEVEIWNLVFTQFNRVGNPPDNLRPLPSKNIDTGMGLERTAATLQGVSTNFHIDILKPLVEAAAEVCGHKYDADTEEGRRLRRIADHVRACTFAVHENVYPGPNKEKYVIRRLLRRAVLDGHQLGLHQTFLHQLVPVVVDLMKSAYPDLLDTTSRVAKVIEQEESSFLGTIDQGLNKINGIFADMQKEGRNVVRAEDIYFMYGTHGFPPELFEQIAAEHNLTFDWSGYEEIIQGADSGPSGPLFKRGPIEALKEAGHTAKFLGYEVTESPARVLGIIAQDHLCDELDEVGHEQTVTVLLDQSPFYGESGGQVGDHGEIVGDNFRFEVTDTQRDGQLILHIGHLRSGHLTDGATCTAKVDVSRRQAIRRAHSATHILHYALQKHLGEHAQQQGSKVDADWLRFDFTNLEPVGAEHLETVNAEIATQIKSSAAVSWATLPLAEARKQGAMMLFGEKYPDPVRMVSMGEFSKELCGGTHLDNTAEVEAFEILSEESVSAGVRRIVAITGPRALRYEEDQKETLTAVCETLGIGPKQAEARVAALTKVIRDLKKGRKSELSASSAGGGPAQVASLKASEIKHTVSAIARQLNVATTEVHPRLISLLTEADRLQAELSAAPDLEELSADQLLENAQLVGDVKLVVASADGANPNLLRQLIDQIRQKAGPVAVMLGSKQSEDKALLVAGLSRELVERGLSAGDWVRSTAQRIDGSGGGKPDMAQAGGKSPAKLPQALAAAKAEFEQLLQSN